MLQDIAPHTFSRKWEPEATPEPTDYVLAYNRNQILSHRADKSLEFPRVSDVISSSKANLTWGFTIDEARYWIWTSITEPHAPGFAFEPTSYLRTTEPNWQSFAGITGKHLAEWYANTRFCGHCGSRLAAFGAERAQVCPRCGHLEFPRISPAVIIGVTDGQNRIVTSRYAGREYKGTALIAGFIEVGETPEDAVRREVQEEVGLRVTNIRYAGSQPWGMDGDLLLGYFCDAIGDTSLKVDTSELAWAEWTSREDLATPETTRTLTNDMMWRFKCGKENF